MPTQHETQVRSMLDAAELGHEVDAETYRRRAPELRTALINAQFELSRQKPCAVVVLMSGVFAAGKSETVNQLMHWLDPRFIPVHALDPPDAQARALPRMWRYWKLLPPRGRIAIFFDHWYTALIDDRSRGKIGDSRFETEVARLLRFERMLADEGVVVLKFNLHISLERQKKRLKKLASDPDTRWRVRPEDVESLGRYDEIRGAYEDVMVATAAADMPWIVVEAADRRYRELFVGETLLDTLQRALAQPAESPESGGHAPRLAEPAPLDKRSILGTLDLKKSLPESAYREALVHSQGRLARLLRHKRFRKHAMIVLFEGNDAAGKGGAIRRVAQALDARSYRIVPIAEPSDEELARPFLWRFWRHLPELGHLAIFDRSWYGRVLVERVEGLASEADWRRAYGEINDFEAVLSEHGIVIVKFWLAISKAEQLRRFRARETSDFKNFKITPSDWRNREKWDAYGLAVDEMITRTGTEASPWTLIEAEDKFWARIAVLDSICTQLEAAL